ncbi:MAG: 50S ribosomal protein L25 [Synergistaceae bacterium]|jgi:large subunit ribosomal protein L25|nr:50S ribosomal protein L25 [Synergistaceae bacterium]
MAVKMKFSNRTDTGKGACRRMRVNGVAPAVFYGPEYKDSVVGSLDAKELSRVADAPNWETSMIDLEMPDGRVEMALLRNVQRHVISRKILHVDLYQLMKGHKVRVAVPVKVVNKDISVGVKMGGVLEQPVREVEMQVLPREMPSEIVIDTAKMTLGSEVFVRDLEMPESADLITSGDAIVVMVSRPRSMAEAPEEAVPDEAAEVEVVGRGKRKEDEE